MNTGDKDKNFLALGKEMGWRRTSKAEGRRKVLIGDQKERGGRNRGQSKEKMELNQGARTRIRRRDVVGERRK